MGGSHAVVVKGGEKFMSLNPGAGLQNGWAQTNPLSYGGHPLPVLVTQRLSFRLKKNKSSC